MMKLLAGDDKHVNNLNDAMNNGPEVPDNVKILISGENDEILANAQILSLFSGVLRSLLSTPCCSGRTPTLLFPECSTFSLVVNIISTGYTFTNGISDEDIKEISETSQLLAIDIKELRQENSSTNLKQYFAKDFEDKKVKERSKIPITTNAAHQENTTESINDVLDSLCKIFDNDQKIEPSNDWMEAVAIKKAQTEVFTKSQGGINRKRREKRNTKGRGKTN